MVKRLTITGLIAVCIFLTGNVFARDLSEEDIVLQKDIESEEQIKQEDMIYELIDESLLYSPALIHMILENKDDINRWLLLLSVLGWTITIVVIIVFPPAGILSALLALVGLKISTIGAIFGLGSLFGAW